MNLEQFLKEIKTKSKLTKNKIVVGKLNDEIVKFLKEKNIPIHSKEIYLTHKDLSHLSRDSKRKRGAGLSDEDILKIPDILKNPSAIFLEKSNLKMNLLYCDDTSKKCIKIVIDTKHIEKKKEFTIIKTAGYINSSDMKNPIFELLIGNWRY